MKKIFIILLFITTGCMKYTDLSDLAIIKSIGIEYENDYTLYAEIYDEIKKDNEPKTKIIKVNGKNINETFNNLKIEYNKELFFSHIDLLILNSNLNKDNYEEIINYSINHNLRNDFLCILSSDINNLFNANYDEIENYLKSNKESKDIIINTLDEVIGKYLNNESIFLTKIDYIDNTIKILGNYQIPLKG